LNKVGIITIHDFLYYFPRDYDDRRSLPRISDLKIKENVTVMGNVSAISSTGSGRKTIIKAVLSDKSGQIPLVWFNQPYLKSKLQTGRPVVISGRVEINKYTKYPQLTVSETEILEANQAQPEKAILPIYPLSTGLKQTKMRSIAKSILKKYGAMIPETLPVSIKRQGNLIDLHIAVEQLHFPQSEKRYLAARNRIVFDEFFIYQVSLAINQQSKKHVQVATSLICEGDVVRNHLSSLPYTLTAAQQRVIKDIAKDVSQSNAMNRLIQGDVGCGKTDVAIMAMLFAIQSSTNAALMAPTEILAVQHVYKLQNYLDGSGVDVILLKGKMPAKERRESMAKLESGNPYLIVGTHALIQDGVNLPNVGLIVIDEQHRFGVQQRMSLSAKGYSPHCLFLTATPIPRSLMLTSFGDLDKSIIDELPPGRKPPKTYFVKSRNEKEVLNFCLSTLEKGEQVYIVFPLVEESEKIDLQSAVEGHERLSVFFAQYSVGLLHGKMHPKDKQDVMDAFKAKKTQVLVATTVIEVGVDVPNASVMVIYHAERFGLSQLHQLRGRVGRGGTDASCFLLGDPKTENGKQRIHAMTQTTDGFKIAEFDLKIRGPGDMLGSRQAGLPDFNLGDLVRDEKILLLARGIAQQLVKNDPRLMHENHRGIRHLVLKYYSTYLGKQLN
jgi:ATP-dependent DNA helicase RecG